MVIHLNFVDAKLQYDLLWFDILFHDITLRIYYDVYILSVFS